MFALALLLATILGAFAPGDLAPATTAPVFAADFPDPMVIRAGSAYYAYATHTPWEKPGRVFPVLRSTDLVNWSYDSDAFTTAPGWGTGDWWGPDVVERGSTFYLFYTGRNRANVHCVAVATASRPAGPFTDAGVLSCGDAAGSGYIDPMAFLDDTGAWLYVSVDGPHHSISALPLGADLLTVSGPRVELFGVSQAWEHGPAWTTVEAPFMVRRGSDYDLFYSGNDWRNDYAEGVATARSPTGPFVKSTANPILHGTPDLRGPGGGSLFNGLAGQTWLAYHAWTAAGRSLHLARVCFAGSRITVGC
jgi:beta-xylosidase